MTTRDKFKAEITRSQSLHKRGAIVTLAGFMLLVLSAPLNGGWLRPIIQITTFIGALTWVYSVLRLRMVIKCPSCGKPLNYLLIDPGYSKMSVIFGIPNDLPSSITACPYCHADFGK